MCGASVITVTVNLQDMVKNRLKMLMKSGKFRVVHGGTTLHGDKKTPKHRDKTVSLQCVVLQCFSDFAPWCDVCDELESNMSSKMAMEIRKPRLFNSRSYPTFCNKCAGCMIEIGYGILTETCTVGCMK